MRTEETVETVETTTEEVVYCDECTDECTDSFDVVPRELCADCSPSSSINPDRPEVNISPPLNIKTEIFATVVLPVTAVVTFLNLLDGEDYAKLYLSGMVAGMLWTAVLILFVLLVLLW